MTTLLYDIIRLDQRGSPLLNEDIEEIEKRFDCIVKEGLYDHSQLAPLPQKVWGRLGQNLVIRFYHHRQATLRCLHNPLVPATNNLAERDLCPLKLKQKISGSFQTEAGAQAFAFLSVRSWRGLPITSSITTRCLTPSYWGDISKSNYIT